MSIFKALDNLSALLPATIAKRFLSSGPLLPATIAKQFLVSGPRTDNPDNTVTSLTTPDIRSVDGEAPNNVCSYFVLYFIV